MIICCGEALIDFIPFKEHQAYQPCPGGSILNIAVGLGRMGVPVGFLSRLSTDLFGDLLVRHLTSNQVDLRYCPRVDGQTTLAFVRLQANESQEAQYAFYTKGAVDRNMPVESLPDVLDDDVIALHFGSISLVLEPGATTFERLMKRESRRRVLTLDPNVRPSLISDWVDYRKRFHKWVLYVDILRLSQVDFDWLCPARMLEDLLPDWFDSGLSLVVLTKGAEGSTAYLSNGTIVSVPAEEIVLGDTVGAGDSFFSALLTFLHDHGMLKERSNIRKMNDSDLQACLTFASKAAAITCSRKGADPPYRHEMP